MPSYLASIEVMLKPLVNDPQGLAVLDSLNNLGFAAARRVRVGKRIEVEVEAPNASNAEVLATEMCERLLANPVIEDFRLELKEINAASES